MISSVAEMYGIHPQTLRLYEREGLLKPSRTEGNTRLYTDEDLQRLEFILSLARDLGVNISGIAIILQMRERMEEMQVQIHDFVKYIQEEVLSRATAAADPSKGAIVPVRRHLASAAGQESPSGSLSRMIRDLATDNRRLVLCFPSSSSTATTTTFRSVRTSSPLRSIAHSRPICWRPESPSRGLRNSAARIGPGHSAGAHSAVREKLKTGTLTAREEQEMESSLLSGTGARLLAGGRRIDVWRRSMRSAITSLSTSVAAFTMLSPITAKASA